MSGEISIYETQFTNDSGDTILVDTKSISYHGENSIETQVFMLVKPEEDWDMMDVIIHDTENDIELRSDHNKIVNYWQHQ